MSNNLELLAHARVAAINLSDSLCWWFRFIRFPNYKSDDSAFPLVILPTLAAYWVDERRKAEGALRPWLDRLTASRDKPIPWGTGWATSATAAWLEMAADIERTVRQVKAESFLHLIDEKTQRLWIGERGRCNNVRTVITYILDPHRDELVTLSSGRAFSCRQTCERLGPNILSLCERLIESNEFQAALQTVNCRGLCYRLEGALLKFDCQLARVEVERDFALLTTQLEGDRREGDSDPSRIDDDKGNPARPTGPANDAELKSGLGKPGRRGYPLEALAYAKELRAQDGTMKVHTIRRKCLERFSADDLPADDDSFRRWLNRKRANRAN